MPQRASQRKLGNSLQPNLSKQRGSVYEHLPLHSHGHTLPVAGCSTTFETLSALCLSSAPRTTKGRHTDAAICSGLHEQKTNFQTCSVPSVFFISQTADDKQTGTTNCNFSLCTNNTQLSKHVLSFPPFPFHKLLMTNKRAPPLATSCFSFIHKQHTAI